MTDDDHPSLGGEPTEPDAVDAGSPPEVTWPDPATEVAMPTVDAVPFDLNAMSALLRSVGLGPEEIDDAREHGHLELLAIEHLVLPEAAGYEVDRYDLPNIRSLNFVLRGLLEEGVAASSRQDAQAKSLGEWLRARLVDVPASLV